MSKRYAQVILLMEDKQHQAFLTRLLQALGYPPRKLRALALPSGSGSGEQYVRENYPREVRELRRRSAHLQEALVVMTDADVKETNERALELAKELEKVGMEPRGKNERIAILIPRRNIMTWITYLLSNDADESVKYPEMKGRERDCQPAVDRLVMLYRSSKSLPGNCSASLVAALRDELPRLK